ncbi:RusA family crossover junction endodeoxyribonuclease [Intrasporangium flavum]|uniref:RusA family crossover junction endodeoxyribonuclease n=1 Tax=Intrasporangium flavum TaxID=1428657 RepID=UPI00096CBBF9|nr:RusA family crossover junction endodeoxyribonuclease [Intrasporangium flavum]
MSRLTFNVNGTPGAQGSKRHVGNGILLESSKKVKPWRADVKAAAEAAHLASDEWDRATGAIGVQITFRFARPKSHYRTGRNAHLLRDDAPMYVTSRGAGDGDKLQRSTFDALTAAGVIADDSLIVAIHAFKVYAARDEIPGATIDLYTVRNIADRQVA